MDLYIGGQLCEPFGWVIQNISNAVPAKPLDTRHTQTEEKTYLKVDYSCFVMAFQETKCWVRTSASFNSYNPILLMSDRFPNNIELSTIGYGALEEHSWRWRGRREGSVD
jgi:hypothetical protein